MTAYDYKDQLWRDGGEGTKLLMEQLSETLRLLRGKQGAEYASFLGGKPGELQGFIAILEKQASDLATIQCRPTVSFQ
jgi:hypothetical protein